MIFLYISLSSHFPGWPATDGFKKRGFLEDFRLGYELAITWGFDCLRWVTRKLCGMPSPPSSPLLPPPRHARRETPHDFPDAVRALLYLCSQRLTAAGTSDV